MEGFGEEFLPGCSPRRLTDAISWTDTDDTASTMNGRDGRGREWREGRGRGREKEPRPQLLCLFSSQSPRESFNPPSFVATTFIPTLRALAFLLRHCCSFAAFEISRSNSRCKFFKFRETVSFEFDPVVLKPSKEMDVTRVLALAIFLLAPLAEAAKDEVPVVQEFHEVMMTNPYSGTAMVADGEVPKEEEEGPSPMSNSDGDNYVGDKRNTLESPVVIIVVVFIVTECCILLFCLICMICKDMKRTEEEEEEIPLHDVEGGEHDVVVEVPA